MLYPGLIVAGMVVLASGGCAGCSSDGFPVDAMVPDAMTLGTVSLAWSVVDLEGQPITCDRVGANSVSLLLRNRGTVAGVPASFSCTNSPSTSQAILAGVYDVSFELRGGGETVAVAPEQRGIVVNADQNTMLAPVAFPVDPRGGLVLQLAAQPATSNCKTPAAMGAGITGITITLVQAGGSCMPVRFNRSRGTTPLEPSYMVNCSSPLLAACIETDETLTVPSMPSGSYTIHVRGKISGVDCWKNDDALQVPAGGKTLVRTLNLAHQDGDVGC